MAGGNGNDVAGGGCSKRRDEIPLSNQVERGRCLPVGHELAANGPLSCAWQVPGEQLFNKLAGGGGGQRLALICPFLEFDESPRVRAFGIEAAELGKLAYGAAWIERPECRLEHLH